MNRPVFSIGDRVCLIHPQKKGVLWPRTHGIVVFYKGSHCPRNPRVRWADGWGTTVKAESLRLLTKEELKQPAPQLFAGDKTPRIRNH